MLAISGSSLVVFIVLCIIYLLWRRKSKKRSRIGADEHGSEGGGCELQDNSLRVVQYSQMDSIGVSTSGDKKGLHRYQLCNWYQ